MRVRLPDKKIIINFPDGMPQEEMRDAIIKNYYPEKLAAPMPTPVSHSGNGRHSGAVDELYGQLTQQSGGGRQDAAPTMPVAPPSDMSGFDLSNPLDVANMWGANIEQPQESASLANPTAPVIPTNMTDFNLLNPADAATMQWADKERTNMLLPQILGGAVAGTSVLPKSGQWGAERLMGLEKIFGNPHDPHYWTGLGIDDPGNKTGDGRTLGEFMRDAYKRGADGLEEMGRNIYNSDVDPEKGPTTAQTIAGIAGGVLPYLAAAPSPLALAALWATSGNQTSREEVEARLIEKGMSPEQAKEQANELWANLGDFLTRAGGSYATGHFLRAGAPAAVKGAIAPRHPYLQQAMNIGGAMGSRGAESFATKTLSDYRADDDPNYLKNLGEAGMDALATGLWGAFSTVMKLGQLKEAKERFNYIRQFDSILNKYGLHNTFAKDATPDILMKEVEARFKSGELTKEQAANLFKDLFNAVGKDFIPYNAQGQPGEAGVKPPPAAQQQGFAPSQKAIPPHAAHGGVTQAQPPAGPLFPQVGKTIAPQQRVQTDGVKNMLVDPSKLQTESGRSIEYADKSELLLREDDSPALGRIDASIAAQAGIDEGDIYVNVGAVHHTEDTHGNQIKKAGYENAQSMILDTLANYNEIREGSDNSILLVKQANGTKSPLVAIELIQEDGVYRAKTAWLARENYIQKRKLLSTRSATLVTGPESGLASFPETPETQGEIRRWSARQESNSNQNIPPRTENVNNVTDTNEQQFKRAYDEIADGNMGMYARIYEVRDKLGWSKDKFDDMLKTLRDKGVLQLTAGAETQTFTDEQIAGSFTDERGLPKNIMEWRADRESVAAKNDQRQMEDVNNMKSGMESDTVSLTIREPTKEEIKLNERIARIKEKHKEKLGKENTRKETKKIISGLRKAAKAKNLSWDARKEIAEILSRHDPKRRFADMTLDQLRELGKQVADIRKRGVREYKQLKAERKERRDKMLSELLERIPEQKPQYGAVTGREDTKKQYKGPKGFLDSAKNFVYSATLPAQKYFDNLDGGRGSYNGPFVKNYVDRPNAARDEELRHTFRRTDTMEKDLKELGFETKDFAETSDVPGAPVFNGEKWTIDEKLSIYAGMKNPKHAKAILYGNFRNLSFQDSAKEHILDMMKHQGVAEQKAKSLAEEVAQELFSGSPDNLKQSQKLILDKMGDEGKIIADMIQQEFKYVNDPEGAAQAIIDSLSDKEKDAADLVIKDLEENRDRIEQAHIRVYGYGFGKEENYTSMWRIEHESNEGIIDADTADALAEGKMQSGALGDVKRGFTIARKKISDKNQKGVELGLFRIWRETVTAQEHMAAYGELLRDLRAVMRARNPANPDMTLGKRIRLAHGDGAWKTLIEHYNVMVNDRMTRDVTPIGRAANKLSQNMNVAYLAFNPGVYIKQTTSIARFLQFTDPVRMSGALTRFIADHEQFLEAIYEKDPQMRDRVPDYILRELKNEHWYDKGINLGLVPISLFDKVTCAVGWQAVYETNLAKGMSVKDAVREAQRAVLLTQPASHIKDVSPILRAGGVEGALTKFSRDRLARWGVLVYDIPQSVRRIAAGDIKGGGRQLLGASAALLVGAMIYQLVTRGLPDKDKKETIREWALDAVTGQVIDAVPVVGPALEARRQGHFRGEDNILAGPLTKTISGVSGLVGDKKERAFFDVLEGAGLMTGKIPFTALRRFYRSWNLLNEGEIARAAKTAIGMKNEDRFDKVASMLSKERRDFEERRNSGENIPLTDRLRIAGRFNTDKSKISKLEKHIEYIMKNEEISEDIKLKDISELMGNIKKTKEDALAEFEKIRDGSENE